MLLGGLGTYGLPVCKGNAPYVLMLMISGGRCCMYTTQPPRKSWIGFCVDYSPLYGNTYWLPPLLTLLPRVWWPSAWPELLGNLLVQASPSRPALAAAMRPWNWAP